MVSVTGDGVLVEARVAKAMTEHLAALAAGNSVTIHWTTKGWREAEAFVSRTGGTEGSAVLPVIRRPSDYLIGLHELGHIIDENARRFALARDQYEEILGESAAWAWAAEQLLQRFLRHIKAEDWDLAAYGWRTYLAGDDWKRRRPKLLPRP